MTKTINPFPSATAAAVEETAAQKTHANTLDRTDVCPACKTGRMVRMTAGVRGENEIPVNVCLQHRVALPVPNSEL